MRTVDLLLLRKPLALSIDPPSGVERVEAAVKRARLSKTELHLSNMFVMQPFCRDRIYQTRGDKVVWCVPFLESVY